MAETSEATASAPQFESPIVKGYPAPRDGSPTLSDESGTTKILVRAAEGTAAADRLGARYGTSRVEAGSGGEVLVSGQRPTEWLLVGARAPVAAMIDGLDRTGHVSVVDHTHSRAMFRLTGGTAASILEKICGLDWSDNMTPDGAVVSGSVAGVSCDLIRNDRTAGDGSRTRSYLLACDRSFAQYLFDAILDAGDEFGLMPDVG